MNFNESILSKDNLVRSEGFLRIPTQKIGC